VKKSTLLTTFSLTLLVGILSCQDEEAKVPALPAAAVPVAQPVPAAGATPEPELKPIEPGEASASSIAPPASAGKLNSTGNYVIQVGIQPSENSANKIAGKLSANGIGSYLAKVENPGELEGTYYRVRIGYFTTLKDAQEYAKSTLEPLGFAWWVDTRRNDEVGNPSTSTAYSSAANIPASYAAPTPQETPRSEAAQPVAADEGWGAPASAPSAPAPMSSTPPKAAPQVVEDGWN